MNLALAQTHRCKNGSLQYRALRALRTLWTRKAPWKWSTALPAALSLCTAFSLFFIGARASQANEQLQMLGAIIANRSGVALIKHRPTGAVKAVKTGESAFGLGTLVSVDRQIMIVLENDGHMTTISSKLGGAYGKKAPPKVLVSTDEKHIEDGFSRIGNKIDVDSRYRDRMIKEELPNILMQASSEPVVVNGEITGFRMFQFDQNSIFAKLGMKDGDVVKEINGVPLNNVAKTIQFLNGLKGESNVAVQIVRDGTPVSLELNVK